MIFDPQVDNRATTDRVLPRVGEMKPKFGVADIEPRESVFERHTIIRAPQ
jgi:hypothetical protein